jgi:hypothetical protein
LRGNEAGLGSGGDLQKFVREGGGGGGGRRVRRGMYERKEVCRGGGGQEKECARERKGSWPELIAG